MMLQHNSDFSQALKQALTIYQLPIEKGAINTSSQSESSLKHGCFLEFKGKRYFELSNAVHGFNFLGFLHPLNLNPLYQEESRGSSWIIEPISTNQDSVDFIQDPETVILNLKAKGFSIVSNFLNNQKVFQIKASEEKSNKYAHQQNTLNYLIDLKIFEPNQLYQQLQKEVQEVISPQWELKGFQLSHKLQLSPSKTQSLLQERGISNDYKQSRSLFIPLSILLQDFKHLLSQIQEATCSA